MSMLVAAFIFIPQLAVAIALLIWSLGGSWPLRDRTLLAATIMGGRGPRLPSRPMLFLLALTALATGTVALALADHASGGWWLSVLGAVLGALFLARGVRGYTRAWRAAHAEEPFATLDRRNYSPAALVIGAGFLILVLLRLF